MGRVLAKGMLLGRLSIVIVLKLLLIEVIVPLRYGVSVGSGLIMHLGLAYKMVLPCVM
jgi:hypothetical protein